mmetsp:Transcript_55891/g.130851  ORF Transcript_55891/g.130851 Transcript_55891/m.130851 type:complete len:1307 (-) Transcript_55891:122-4042(-)
MAARKLHRKAPGAEPVLARDMAAALFDGKGVENRDVDDLLQVSHKKSRAVLRHLTLSGQPRSDSKQAGISGGFQRAGIGISMSSPNLPPLQVALGDSPQAESTRHQIMRERKGLLEDHTTLVVADGGSLNWIDLEGVYGDRSLDESAPFAQAKQDTKQLIAKQSLSSTRARRSFFEQRFSASKVQPAQRSPWASMRKFERHYHPPVEDLLPPRPIAPPAPPKDPRGLQARETVARIEEMISPGLQMPLWSAHLATAPQPQAANKRGSIKGLGPQGRAPSFFKAVAIYRRACMQLGIEVLAPMPILGEIVELSGEGCRDTRQCYAVAEGVRVCEPSKLALEDMGLTDIGAARIVEVALATARLKELVITKSWLGFKTCSVLHTCLRTRAGSTLNKLVLQECGIGSNLEVDLSELPAHQHEVFAHCLSEQELQEDELVTKANRGPLRLRQLSRTFDQEKSTSQSLPAEASLMQTDSRHNASSGVTGASIRAQRPTVTDSDVGLDRLSDGLATRSRDDFLATTQSSRGFGGDSSVYKEVALEDLGLPSHPPTRQVPLLLPLLFQLPHATCGIQYLDLSLNLLSKEAGSALGKFLSASRIEFLILNQCGLGDEAVNSIADGFAENSTLMDVRLRSNALSGDVLPSAALLNAAGRHPRMAHLDLAENMLSRSCSDELCSAFRWSCSLVAVHVLGPSSGPEASEIAECCLSWVAANGEEPCSGLYSTPKILDDNDDEKVFRTLEHPEMILCRALHSPGLESWRITQPVPPQLPLRAHPEEHAVAPRSFMPCGCWVCNKCEAITFKYVVPDHGLGSSSGGVSCRLFVRPSFAGFQRVELKRERSDVSNRVVYSSKLLVPLGQHCYLFEAALGPRKFELMCAEGQPKSDLQDLPLEGALRDGLQAFCRARKYTGAINTLPIVSEDGFHIPEALEMADTDEVPQCDPWAVDTVRKQRLDECCRVDVGKLQMSDLCHSREEDEVKEVIAELYSFLYETYAIFAGRSLWPLVRQVDVYAFFDEAQILLDSPFAKDIEAEESAPSDTDAAQRFEEQHKVSLQDVQQMLVQAIGTGQRPRESHGSEEADAPGPAAGSDRFAQMCAHTNPSLQERAATVVERHREGAPITRSQFIEVLLRAAVAIRGRELSAVVCIRTFVKKVLLGRIMQPPLSPFPRGLLKQAGGVRDALLSHRKMLIEAYERFGSTDAAFQRFAQLLRLCDRTFTAKHVSSIFTLVKLPIVDTEAEPLRRGLSYEEFCEAAAWLSVVWQRGWSQGHAKRDPKLRFRALPKVGAPLNQRHFASHLEAFLQKMRQRMLPR